MSAASAAQQKQETSGPEIPDPPPGDGDGEAAKTEIPNPPPETKEGAKPDRPDNLRPLVPAQVDFGLARHKYQQFSVIVPVRYERRDLEDSRLWSYLATSVKEYDEIRAVCSDGSFYARLLVTDKIGGELRVKELEFVQLETVDRSSEERPDYVVRQKGPLKWCIVKVADGTNVREKIPTQKEALKQRDDLVKALRR